MIETLRRIVGGEHVLDSHDDRRYHAADFVAEADVLPTAVVRPRTTAEVAAVMREAAAAGVAVVARGGGMSYVRAHLTSRPDTLVLDMTRFIDIEVHADDRYVVCGVGVTWASLRQALAGTGLWAAHLGTLSGLYATVGGGVSQQVAGLTATSLTSLVLGVEVVLADGSVVRTGSWAATNGRPFMRDLGPDLTGLFLCDSGAMGVKTRVALRLDPVPCSAYGCFAVDDRQALVTAITEIGWTGAGATVIGMDRYILEQMRAIPAPPRSAVVDMAKAVVRASTPRWRGIRTLAQMGGPSMRYLDRVQNLLAVVCDSADSAAADRQLRRVRRIVRRHGGRPVPSALAVSMRHMPFNPIYPLMFGSGGESNVPSNMLVPLSDATVLVETLDRLLDEQRAVMEEHGIFVSYNWLVIGHVFGVEPLLYFPGRPGPYRLRWASDEQRAAFAEQPERPEAFEAAMALRHEMIAVARALGSTHIQIGRVYPLAEALGRTPAWDLLEAVKSAVDPGRMVNPGVLGLRDASG